MRCISLWQPWASLVAHSLKHFETRSWYTSYRGSLAIHAAKRKADFYECNPTIVKALLDIGYQRLSELPYGCIVCIAQLVDCEPTARAVERFERFERMGIAATEQHFGDYSPGRFAWQLDNIVQVNDIPARGSQGFWNWQPPDEIDVLPSFLQGMLI